MNKLVIFDLDGVLIDSRDIHYIALNDALRLIDDNLVITIDEHLSLYDGLNTTRKLEMLSERKGLDRKYYNQIWEEKQKATILRLKGTPKSNFLNVVFRRLKFFDFKI